MRLALILSVSATPALAHHEAVVASAFPTIMAAAAFVAVAAGGAWHRWRKRRPAK